MFVCFFDDTEPSEIYTYLHSLSLHDPLPICSGSGAAANSGANSPSASTAGVDGQSASISAGTSGLRGAGCGGALRTSTGVLAGSALGRSEEHTSELQSLMRITYAVFCLKKKNNNSICFNKKQYTPTMM